MSLSSARRLLISRIALFAILMASLAPTLSHLLRAADFSGWTEVCSAIGAKWVRVASTALNDSTPAPLTTHALEHCPYCSLHVADLGLPPTFPVALRKLQSAFHLPDFFLAAPRTLFAWVSAQPRAPPLFS